MKKYFALALIMILTGCASSNFSSKEKDIMNSWLGHKKSELILSWGPPKNTVSDGNNGEILIYEASMNFGQTPGSIYSNQYNNNIYYTNPQSNVVTRQRMFYINSEGTIYHWMSIGRPGY